MAETRKRPRLQVGQIWICHNADYPHQYWRFEIVAQRLYEGIPYYVALKCNVVPDSVQAVVFDAQGTSQCAQYWLTPFVCTRLSRQKPGRA